MIRCMVLFISSFLFLACNSSTPEKADKGDKKGKSSEAPKQFVFKETMVTGGDTAMVRLGRSSKVQLGEVLCQQWELTNNEGTQAIEQTMDENNKRIFPGLIFFSDSQVVENPRSHLRIGKWKASSDGTKIIITLLFGKGKQKQYAIRSVTGTDLWLREKSARGDSINLHLESDGLRHQNLLNDPFHPANIQWMLKPARPENDSMIYQRTKQCVKFFALYYRDRLKRNTSSISFVGLPDIFEWYSGGIGLPDRKLVDDSWYNCFYSKQQALKGYDILRTLIVDYQFDWDKNAPGWAYQTHSVLEQMYGKMK